MLADDVESEQLVEDNLLVASIWSRAHLGLMQTNKALLCVLSILTSGGSYEVITENVGSRGDSSGAASQHVDHAWDTQAAC